MKLLLVASSACSATSTLLLTGQQKHAKKSQGEMVHAAGGPLGDGVHYGDSRCPCIGFDNIDGETLLQIDNGAGEVVDVSYPADIGARCEAWDDKRHLQCQPGAAPGSGAGWCAQSWCYVDPCKCDIDALPKLTAYNMEATYRGMPLFWSYATCDGKDMFTKKIPQVGTAKCRCIGFAGVSGNTEITFKDGAKGEYPADIGGTCAAWDESRHPECKGDQAPLWCRATWCYVDPCDCDLPGTVVPKISAYLPDATFTGKNLYYSYETCGSPDTWTEENHYDACVNQETQEECGRLTRCAWSSDASRCLGTELVNHPLCKEAAVKYMKKFEAHSGSPLLECSWVVKIVLAAVMAAAAGAM